MKHFQLHLPTFVELSNMGNKFILNLNIYHLSHFIQVIHNNKQLNQSPHTYLTNKIAQIFCKKHFFIHLYKSNEAKYKNHKIIFYHKILCSINKTTFYFYFYLILFQFTTDFEIIYNGCHIFIIKGSLI